MVKKQSKSKSKKSVDIPIKSKTDLSNIKPPSLSLAKDCLDCSRYLSCNKAEKAVGFICKKFTLRETLEFDDAFSRDPDGPSFDEIDMSDVEGEGSSKRANGSKLDLDRKINVADMISAVLETDLLTPVDTKIDDSPVPQAKNFYEFSTGQKFLSVKPYLFQMMYITQLFAEWCPRCSDTHWMRNEAKVNDTLVTFKSKVQLLEFGVCPKCRVRKSELVRSGELNAYQELAGLAGQRCLVADTLVHTSEGLTHIGELDEGDIDTGFNEVDKLIVDGNFYQNKTTAIFKSLPEQTHIVRLANGMEIEGTAEHPIRTATGYLPLAAIGELNAVHPVTVPVRYDYTGFGSETMLADQAAFLGYWVANGHSCVIKSSSPRVFKVVRRFFPHAAVVPDGENSHVTFDATNSVHTLQDLLGEVAASPEYRTIPKSVRQCDRSTAIIFLRSYFLELLHTNDQNELFVDVANRRLMQALFIYLQMLNIKCYTDNLRLYIDGISNELFTKTLGLGLCLNNPNNSRFIHYDFDRVNNVYQIPVATVDRGGVQLTYDFVVPSTESFIANGIDNHNSGKSAVVAMCCAYLLHRQLKLQKPNEVYGLLPANVLHGTFVALTYKQAAETLWEPFLAYITDSPWFCVSEDTMIDLVGGLKKAIKDIEQGDEVMTFEGSSKVSHVFFNGVQECYRVTLANGQAVEATDKHKFRAVEGDNLVWKRLSDLRVGDKLVVG